MESKCCNDNPFFFFLIKEHVTIERNWENGPKDLLFLTTAYESSTVSK